MRLRKKIVLAISIPIGVILLIILLLHTPFVRTKVLHLIQNNLLKNGIIFSTDSFKYNLFNLKVKLKNIELRSSSEQDLPAFFSAEELNIQVPLKIILGKKIEIKNLEMKHPSFIVQVDEAGVSNLPRGGDKSQSTSEHFQMPDFKIKKAVLTGARFEYQNKRKEISANIEGIGVRIDWIGEKAHSLFLNKIGTGTIGYQDLDHKLEDIQLNLLLKENGIDIEELKFSLAENEITFSGYLNDFISPNIYGKANGRLNWNDIGVFVPVPESPSGFLNFDLEFQGCAEEGYTTAVSLKNDSTYLRGFEKTDVSLEAHWKDDILTVASFDVFAGEGRIGGKGKLFMKESLSSNDFELNWERIDLKLFQPWLVQTLPIESLSSGKVNLRWNKLALDNLNMKADIRFDPPKTLRDSKGIPLKGAINASIKSGVVDVSLREFNFAKTDIRGDLRLINNSMSGHYWIETKNLSQTISILDPFIPDSTKKSLQQLSPGGNIQLSGKISGKPVDPAIEIEINGKDISIERLLGLNIEGRVNLDKKKADINSFKIYDKDMFLELSGKLPFDMRNNEVDISIAMKKFPVQRIIEEMNIDVDAEAVIDLSASIKGTITDPVVKMSLFSDSFKCFNQEFGKIDLTARFEDNNISIESLTVHKDDAQISVNGFYDTKKQSYFVDLVIDSFNLDKFTIPGSTSSLNGSMNMTVLAKGSLLSPEITAKISAQALEYAGVNIGDIRLHSHFNQDDFFTVFILSNYNTLVRAWAPSEMIFSPLQTSQNEKMKRQAEVSIETGNLEFFRLLSLIPFFDQENIKGKISTRIRLASLDRSLKGLSGTAEIKIAGLEVRNIPVYQENPIEISLKNGKIGFRNFYFRGKEGELHAEGYMDLFKDNLIDLMVDGEIDLGVFQDRLDEGQISGKIDVSTHISNTISSPDIKGEITLRQINFLLPYPGIYIRNINGNVQVYPERILIQNISGDFNGGDLNVNGGMTLAGMAWTEAEVNIKLNNIWMEMPLGLSSRINSNLIFTSKQERNSLTGEVWLSDTLFTENFSIQSTLYKYLQRSPVRRAQTQKNPFLDTLNLNLSIRTDTNIRIDNNIADSELKADLKLNGTASHPSLAGRALIEQGEIYFSGNTFIIEEGVIDFINPNQIEPYLNIKARTRVNEYDILLTVTGPTSKLSASMSSDPALKQVDIISLLVTGSTLESASASALDIAGSEVLTYLNNALTGRLENVVKDFFGLDSVKIDAGLIASQENPNSRLTLGQNLTRELKLIYSQDIKDAHNQTWIIDYYPYRKLNVQGIKSDNNAYSLGVKHNIVFGGKSGEDPAFDQEHFTQKNKVGSIILLGDSQFVSEIKSLLKTKKGRSFDFYTFHKDMGKIRDYFIESDHLNHSLEAFREMKPDNTVDLTIKFDPGPKVFFRFWGVSFSPSKIQEIKKIWSRAGTEQFAIREVEKYLRLYLIKKKYYRSEIQVKEVSASQGQKIYKVSVAAGLKYKSINTKYSGNQYFSSSRLDKIVKRQEYIQEVLLYPAKFKKNLQQHFSSFGFLDAKVQVVKVEFDPEAREMLLLLSIIEGKRYRLGRIVITGNRFLSSDDIKQILALKEGSVFSFDHVSKQTLKIREDYNRNGFNDVKINSQILPDEETGSVDLLLDISENQKGIISAIRISGFRKTKEYAIRRELEFQIGDTVDFHKINASRKNLYDLGIFEYVNIEVIPEEGDGSKETQTKPDYISEKPFRIHVNVYENHPYQFKYGLEYSTETSLGIAGEIRDVNWGGNAHLLGSSFRYNRDEKDLRVFYRSFYFLRKKINTELFSFANRMARPGFTIGRFGFTFQQQMRLGNTYLLTYSYTHEGNRIFDKDPFLELSGDQDVNIGTFSLGLIRDTRSNVLNPMSGMFFSHNLEYAPGVLGTEIKYFRYFGQNYFYLPITGSWLYALGLRMGLSKAFDQEVPLSKRFYAGGSTTVRGFEKNGLGDRDIATGLALGGEAVFILNQELRIPLVRKIRGAVFFDIGNVYPTLSMFNLNNMRETIGFGLRYHSPYFLIRFDWGFILDLRPGEKRSQVYFSIGQSF